MDWSRGTGNRLSARLFRPLRASFLEPRCADLRLSSDAPSGHFTAKKNNSASIQLDHLPEFG